MQREKFSPYCFGNYMRVEDFCQILLSPTEIQDAQLMKNSDLWSQKAQFLLLSGPNKGQLHELWINSANVLPPNYEQCTSNFSSQNSFNKKK